MKEIIFGVAMLLIIALGIWYWHYTTEMEYKRILKAIAKSPITLIVFIWGWLRD